jgi:hypothetical protein
VGLKFGAYKNLEYHAVITLTAKNDYEFAGDISFAYEGEMVREQTSDDNDHPTSRTVNVVYMAVTAFSPSLLPKGGTDRFDGTYTGSGRRQGAGVSVFDSPVHRERPMEIGFRSGREAL